MSLFDRFRYAIAGMRRRPGTTLVRVGRSEPLPRPGPRQALPPPEHPICRRCGTRHEPRPQAAGGGLAATYGRPILPDPARPTPLGRGPAHDKALYRDQVSAWRHGTLDPPPPSLDLAEIREELYAPRTYWWEQRD